MDRREFARVMGVVVAGLMAGSRVSAEQKKTEEKADKHICKGKGGCKTGDKGCAGKNSCKGKGGCSVPVDPEHLKPRK